MSARVRSSLLLLGLLAGALLSGRPARADNPPPPVLPVVPWRDENRPSVRAAQGEKIEQPGGTGFTGKTLLPTDAVIVPTELPATSFPAGATIRKSAHKVDTDAMRANVAAELAGGPARPPPLIPDTTDAPAAAQAAQARAPVVEAPEPWVLKTVVFFLIVLAALYLRSRNREDEPRVVMASGRRAAPKPAASPSDKSSLAALARALGGSTKQPPPPAKGK